MLSAGVSGVPLQAGLAPGNSLHNSPVCPADITPNRSIGPARASAASARPEGWSSDTPRTVDISREGPFDAYTSPMDMEDSPLVTTGLPGCPYRIMSYTGPAVADTNPAFGMQLHHPRFLEFIGAPAVVSFADVLGGPVRRRGCYGGGSQPTGGCWYHVVEPSDSFAVCYVAAYDVLRDDDTRDGTCGVPIEGDRGFIHSTKGALGGQGHGCHGSVAPTDWSGRSRAGAGLVM